MIAGGFIKLYRLAVREQNGKPKKKLDALTLGVYTNLLIDAQIAETRLPDGRILHRGQLSTSRSTIASTNGISEQEARTALNRLKSTNLISIESTNSGSIITLENIDGFEDSDLKINQPQNEQINQPTLETSTNPPEKINQPINQPINHIIRNKEKDKEDKQEDTCKEEYEREDARAYEGQLQQLHTCHPLVDMDDQETKLYLINRLKTVDFQQVMNELTLADMKNETGTHMRKKFLSIYRDGKVPTQTTSNKPNDGILHKSAEELKALDRRYDDVDSYLT